MFFAASGKMEIKFFLIEQQDLEFIKNPFNLH